jgi:hypothetical protein
MYPMRIEAKDPNFLIYAALRACGFNLKPEDVELFLNVSDMVRADQEKTTMHDILYMKAMIEGRPPGLPNKTMENHEPKPE